MLNKLLPAPLRSRLQRARSSQTARNTSWAMVADVGQLVVSFGTFVVLARLLGIRDFGYFSAATAMAVFAGNFAWLGTTRVIVMKVARGEGVQQEWSRRSTLMTGSSLFATAFMMALQPLLLPELSAVTFLLLVVNQILFFGLAELGVAVAMAHKQLDVSASLRGMTAVIRLMSLGAFAVVGDGSLGQWAWYSAAAGVMSVLLTLWQLWLEFEIVPGKLRPDLRDVREGIPFAAGATANGMLDAIDRPMLVRFGFPDQAGAYSAAYRIGQLSTLPISALVSATDADFFAAGARGASGTVALFRKLVIPATVVSALVGAGMFVCAPLIPMVVGNEYQESVEIIRWLAILPVLRANQVFPSNAIIASGRPMVSVGWLVTAAAVNFCINLVLIPAYSWKGALIATYIAEVVYAVLLWTTALRYGQRDAQVELATAGEAQ